MNIIASTNFHFKYLVAFWFTEMNGMSESAGSWV